MTLEELRSIIQAGESESVELKKSTGQRSAAARTACAMLNGPGGFIFFGIKSDGTVVGQEISDSTLRQVVAELQKIEPQIVIQPEVLRFEGNHGVIVLSVPAEGSQTYSYDGRPYVRNGPETVRMSQDAYRRRLFRERDLSERWEVQDAARFGLEDLDSEEIIRTVDEAVRRGRMEDPGTRDTRDLLLGLGLLRGGQVTNAAVVLFGKSKHLLPSFPQTLLRMARFEGATSDRFIDNRQEHGHAFDLYRRAQRFLRDHLPVAGRVLPGVFEREDEPLYPPEALREAVANALCHRDYSVGGGSVGIAIFDDRLEISSTGSLPHGLTPADLIRPHSSRPRNELMAAVFYRRGLIEQWGRGTLKIIELAGKAGLAEPEFEDRAGEVIVRFRPTRYIAPRSFQHELSPLQQELLEIIGNHGPMRLSDIRARLTSSTPESTVQANLKTLRDIELIRLAGHGRGARWRLK